MPSEIGLAHSDGTEVAVKVISQQGSSSLQRLPLREVLCMKVLNRPNIVKLFKAINTKETSFLLMEHLSGRDMQDHGCMTGNGAQRVFQQLLHAMQVRHQRGIVHRGLEAIEHAL